MGEGLSLTVYVKTEGVGRDEEVVLNRSKGLEFVAIANIGRNEHTYVRHLARRYTTFPDVQILTKTNSVTPQMIKLMVDANQNNSYGFISHPWQFQRRYLTVRCDYAWREHALYPEFCENLHPRPYPRMPSWGGAALLKEVPGVLIIRQSRVGPGTRDLAWPLFNSQGRLPFLHETYGEGMYSIRRDVLTQYPRDWYLMWKNITYEIAKANHYEGGHHDDAMMEVFPLALSKEDGMHDFPAYHISPSTVDLFDRH